MLRARARGDAATGEPPACHLLPMVTSSIDEIDEAQSGRQLIEHLCRP